MQNTQIHKNHMKCDKVDTTVCSAVGKRLKINSWTPFERAQYLLKTAAKIARPF